MRPLRSTQPFGILLDENSAGQGRIENPHLDRVRIGWRGDGCATGCVLVNVLWIAMQSSKFFDNGCGGAPFDADIGTVHGLQERTPNASGKTLAVASTHGNVPAGVKVDGQEVIVGVNVYIMIDSPDTTSTFLPDMPHRVGT